MTDLTPIRAVTPTLKTQLVPLGKLTISKLNVRKHGSKSVATLAASIAAKGLLQPLLVRPSGKSFEVIFGQRRTLALQKLHAAKHPDTNLVPCIVSDMNDAAAIAASLAENIERLPMDLMDQYEAFVALAKEGQSEADIASHFGITEQAVKRALALGRLIPSVRSLYRAGNINNTEIQLLTLAAKERQAEYVALARDGNAPPHWKLKAWILGGAVIATDVAIFPLEAYTAPIAADLFDQGRYFTDAEEFWRLQNNAIAERKAALEATGWTVELFEPGTPFHAWQYEKLCKDKGGHAILEIEANGAVATHKGFIHRDELARRCTKRKGKAPHAGEDSQSPEGDTPRERAELTDSLANYIDLVRHASVRAALTEAPQTALRIAAAQLIAGSSHWRITPEPRRAHANAIAEAVSKLAADERFSEAQAEAHKLIGKKAADTEPEDGRIVAPELHDFDRTIRLYERFKQLDDAEVLKLLTIAVAETLAIGTSLVDQLGSDLGVDILKDWQPDPVMFTLIRDKDTLSEMLAEVAGKLAADTYLTATGTKKKEIIQNTLTGNSRRKTENWKPRWLSFPQAQYTKRPLTRLDRPSA